MSEASAIAAGFGASQVTILLRLPRKLLTFSARTHVEEGFVAIFAYKFFFPTKRTLDFCEQCLYYIYFSFSLSF